MTLKDKKKEIAFCRYISTLYSDDSRKIDYLIGYTYIKLFFYFNCQIPFDTTYILDELNCGLKVFKLKRQCEFYMRLNKVESHDFNMCWTFFSYGLLDKHYS